MKLRYIIALIIIFLLINASLLHQNFKLRKYIKDVQAKNFSLSINSVPNFKLNDLYNSIYNSEEIISSSTYTLLIFFSLTDCASCLYEKELWKEISEEGKVKIIGIARHTDKRELKDWIENSEIDFPILYDVDSKVTKIFGIKKTPLKLLINDEGKIILADSVRIHPSQQKNFIKQLNNIILKKN